MTASVPPPARRRPTRRRTAFVAASAAGLVAAGLGVVYTQNADAAATGTCTATLTAGTAWGDRYNSTVTVSGSGTWTVALAITSPQKVSTVWNGTSSTNGGTVTVTANGSGNAFGFTTMMNGNSSARPKVSSCTTTTGGGSTTAPTQVPTTAAPNAAADITVNSGTKYQTVDGFGAATPIWGGTWSTAETQTLVGLGNNQLGLSIVRTGLSPVSGEWSANVNALKTAKSYGSNVKILASPWTAPAAWKTNNSRINGGKLKTDYYDDYANHLNSYVQYMRGQGVAIDVTSVQNEPDWHPSYDSMDWSGTELRNFVRDQGSKVKNTKLMVAEALGMSYDRTDPTLNDASARNNIGYIGGHLYGTEEGGRLKPYALADAQKKPVWMTEWNFHEADGSGAKIWGDGTNQKVWDETLDRIVRTVHKSMESNWSAYIWWYGKRYYSFIGDGEAAYGTTTGTPLKRGYAFSQYSKYVRPGYQRVALSKSSKANPLEITAYQGNGKTTLVILNRSTSAVNNAVVQAPANVTKAEYYVTSRSANAAAQSVAVNGRQATVSVPARSISTVVLSS